MSILKFASALAAVVTLATTALPTRATAQEPRRLTQPDSISLDFAMALAATAGFPGSPQFLVGAMPDWVANKVYVPSGARVLGALFLGTVAEAMVSVPGTPAAAIADARKTLLGKGWKNPPTPPSGIGGGFRPAPTAQAEAGGTRATLCEDQQILTASASIAPGAGTIITYRLSSTTGFSSCRLPDLPVPSGIRPPWPTLYDPAGTRDAQSMLACSTGAFGGIATSTTLGTAMSPKALLDHYGAQLADSGWKQVADTSASISRTWTRTDSAGNPLEASITVHSFLGTSNCRDASLQVRTLRKP
ncbi:MAG TPA: hypothetical protein VGM67_18230 [Gemmatimonadaceae bacterium]|jgi:hypothetical protein